MYFHDVAIDAFYTRAAVIVLDMNGLIIDDEGVQLWATNEALKSCGLSISDDYWSERCVGRRPREYLREILESVSLPTRLIDQLVNYKEACYGAFIRKHVGEMVRPGVAEFIEAVLRHDKTLCLATSTTKRGVQSIMGSEGLGWSDAFKFTITGDDVERAKPDPEIYSRVRDNFREGSRLLVLEDSLAGIRSAKSAALSCIAVPNKYTLSSKLFEADLVISDLSPTAISMSKANCNASGQPGAV